MIGNIGKSIGKNIGKLGKAKEASGGAGAAASAAVSSGGNTPSPQAANPKDQVTVSPEASSASKSPSSSLPDLKEAYGSKRSGGPVPHGVSVGGGPSQPSNSAPSTRGHHMRGPIGT